jgi:hypothetical protein
MALSYITDIEKANSDFEEIVLKQSTKKQRIKASKVMNVAEAEWKKNVTTLEEKIRCAYTLLDMNYQKSTIEKTKTELLAKISVLKTVEVDKSIYEKDCPNKITIAQCVERTKLTDYLIRSAIRNGNLKTHKIGNVHYIIESTLSKFENDFDKRLHIYRKTAIKILTKKAHYDTFSTVLRKTVNSSSSEGISIKKLMNRGEIDTYKIGAAVFVTKASFRKLIAQLDGEKPIAVNNSTESVMQKMAIRKPIGLKKKW